VRPEGTRNGNRSKVRCGWTRGGTGEPRDGIYFMSVKNRGLAGGSDRFKHLVGGSSGQGGNLWLINVIKSLQSVEIRFGNPLPSKESANRRVTLRRKAQGQRGPCIRIIAQPCAHRIASRSERMDFLLLKVCHREMGERIFQE
jgi:hypothetical protein